MSSIKEAVKSLKKEQHLDTLSKYFDEVKDVTMKTPSEYYEYKSGKDSQGNQFKIMKINHKFVKM